MWAVIALIALTTMSLIGLLIALAFEIDHLIESLGAYSRALKNRDQRYLENRIRESYPFEGTPIELTFRGHTERN